MATRKKKTKQESILIKRKLAFELAKNNQINSIMGTIAYTIECGETECLIYKNQMCNETRDVLVGLGYDIVDDGPRSTLVRVIWTDMVPENYNTKIPKPEEPPVRVVQEGGEDKDAHIKNWMKLIFGTRK